MQIYAMMFQVENDQTTGTTYLIAWIDDNGYSKTCYHSHPNKTLLDVEPGHIIIHNKQKTRYQVVGLKPFRTSECRDETAYEWVTAS